MDQYLNIRTELFRKLYTKLGNESGFVSLALEIFRFQYSYNTVYKQFVDLLKIDPDGVEDIRQIPFLPIQLFKSNTLKTGVWESRKQFKSSSTTGQTPSVHHIRDLDHYNRNTVYCFETLIGQLKDYRWYGMLPNYIQQGNSSLVHMVAHFMDIHPGSNGGFYLHEYKELVQKISEQSTDKKPVLIGVSYALLDMAQQLAPDLSEVLIVETGGMKGRGKELPRAELHEILKEKFNVSSIYSEYGMAELMSQAYSKGDGIMNLAPTMKVFISELNDFRNFLPFGQQGKVNIVDLANIDSCCFIATDDLGVSLNHKQFKITGRTDASELRGCNLLYTG